jgi:PhnB protein
MTTTERTAGDEAAIRRRIESWSAALRAKDLEAVRAHWAPDLVEFGLAPGLEHRGEAVASGLASWFPTWSGPIGYELRDLAVVAGGDVAFVHALVRLSGEKTTGERPDVWFRSTVCFRKIDGEWMIAHEHASVPFYMDGSYRAAVDLRP